MSNKSMKDMKKSEGQRTLEPQFRFPEFLDTKSWSTEFGAKVFDQISNKDHNSDLPILAITQEHGAIPRDLIDYHVSVADASIEGYKVVEVGDFIISLRSFQGGIEFSNYRGICSPAYVILRLKTRGCPDYFRHYFKTDRFIGQMTKNIEGLRDGKMISYKQFSELTLAFPSRTEQQRIADCLSSLDEVIAKESQRLTAHIAHKNGLMQKLFPSVGKDVPEFRFPEFKKDGAWSMISAGQLFLNRIERGRSGLPIYSVTMTDGLVPRASLDRKIDDAAEMGSNKTACKGDIVYNMMRMWQGALGVVPEDCMVSPAYVVLEPQGINPFFFLYLLKLPQSLQALTAHSRGLTGDRLRLYYEDFAKILLQYPSLTEQNRIAECLTSVDQLITTQRKIINSLNTHKKGLMQRLFPIMDQVHA